LPVVASCVDVAFASASSSCDGEEEASLVPRVSYHERRVLRVAYREEAVVHAQEDHGAAAREEVVRVRASCGAMEVAFRVHVHGEVHASYYEDVRVHGEVHASCVEVEREVHSVLSCEAVVAFLLDADVVVAVAAAADVVVSELERVVSLYFGVACGPVAILVLVLVAVAILVAVQKVPWHQILGIAVSFDPHLAPCSIQYFGAHHIPHLLQKGY